MHSYMIRLQAIRRKVVRAIDEHRALTMEELHDLLRMTETTKKLPRAKQVKDEDHSDARG